LYDFKTLSPADFEELTRDLLQRHWKVKLESFKTGRDQGIDLRYAAVPSQAIVIQCKHFVGSNIAKLARECRDKELPKIKRLAPKRYVLVTSLSLNPTDKDKLMDALNPYVTTTDDIVGTEDMNNLLGIHSEIETKHFKLWLSSTAVLERVFHNAEQVQTDFNVERVRRAIPLYVQTNNYPRAMKILEDHRFVIISGVPGIGKTTLAGMLLFAHLEAGYQPVVIKSKAVEGREQFKNELRQIFYFDDFLGETFLGNRFDFLGKKEDSAILEFMEIVARSKHSRLILATREHILRHAFQISEHFRRQQGGLADHRCVLELSGYNLLDRGRILYNHIYFSDLPKDYKVELLKDSFYMEILKHRNFNPRLVEWLSRYTNVKALPSTEYRAEVERVLENPEELWSIAFEQQISEASRSVILALYSLGGSTNLNRLEGAWRMLHQHRARKYNWKTAAEDWRRSLQDLEGGFLVFNGGEAAFVNPSVKDFLDTTLTRDREHLDDLLSSACLFEQIVTVWSLARSEKGKNLRQLFKQSPGQLLGAITQNLQKPHQEKIAFDGGGYAIRELDVRPEVRLGTMVSIADNTRSEPALQTIASYAQGMIGFWSKNTPDYDAAVSVLRALDHAKWGRIVSLDLPKQIRAGVLSSLAKGAEGEEIGTIIGYGEAETAHWSKNEQQALVNIVEYYLENTFDEELGNLMDERELENFSETIGGMGHWCGIDVDSYQDQIGERIESLRQAAEENEEPPRRWEGTDHPMSEQMQEAEIRRLFDGLR
jgi:Restriction endonuclease